MPRRRRGSFLGRASNRFGGSSRMAGRHDSLANYSVQPASNQPVIE